MARLLLDSGIPWWMLRCLRFPVSQHHKSDPNPAEVVHFLNMGAIDPITADSKVYSSSSSSPERRDVNDTKSLEAYTSARAVEPPKSNLHSTFDKVDDYRHYKPISTYEGLHRWDPEFEWEPQEEKRLVRRVEYYDPSRDCITEWSTARLQNLRILLPHVLFFAA